MARIASRKKPAAARRRVRKQQRVSQQDREPSAARRHGRERDVPVCGSSKKFVSSPNDRLSGRLTDLCREYPAVRIDERAGHDLDGVERECPLAWFGA
jgi:hypothetical protein